MHASDPTSVHQEPVKVTLFGKSVLGIISDLKVILDYLGVWVGPKPSDQCPDNGLVKAETHGEKAM